LFIPPRPHYRPRRMDAINGDISRSPVHSRQEPDIPAVEFERADPPRGLTAEESLVYVPAAVAISLRGNNPVLAIRVFVWGANAVCQVVRDAVWGGTSPFEESGVYYSPTVVAALRELEEIRKGHFRWFNEPCFTLNALLLWLAHEAHQQRWRRCGVDLDEVGAEEGE